MAYDRYVPEFTDKNGNVYGVMDAEAREQLGGLIDDTAGTGDSTKVWSADKSASENNSLKSAINVLEESLPTEETGQDLLDEETMNAGLTETALAVIGLLFERMPQDESAVDIYHSLVLENERLLAIYEIWNAERSA